MFNADIISEIKTEANMVIIPGDTVTIPKADHIHFLKLKSCGRAKDIIDNTKISCSGSNCESCEHILLQADKKIRSAPCCKSYE